MFTNKVHSQRMNIQKLKKDIAKLLISNVFHLWEQRESNPRPSACKADALNQLSYAPFKFGIAKIRRFFDSANFI